VICQFFITPIFVSGWTGVTRPTFSTNVCNGHSVTVNVQDGRYLAFGELQNEDLVTSDWYNLASNDDQIIFTFRPN
jgi:hypothetical protein